MGGGKRARCGQGSSSGGPPSIRDTSAALGSPKAAPKAAGSSSRALPAPPPSRPGCGQAPTQHSICFPPAPSPPQRLPPAPHATRACKQPRAAAGGRGQSRAAAVQLKEGPRGTSRADSCGDSCGDGAERLSRNRAGEARQEASALPCGRLLPCCPNPAVQVDYWHWRWLRARGGSSKTCPISPG